MRTSQCLLAMLALTSIACSHSDQGGPATFGAKPKGSKSDLDGSWEATASLAPGGIDDVAGQRALQAIGMTGAPILQIDRNQFFLNLILPCRGSFKIDGNTITLLPEDVAGKPVGQYKGQISYSPASPGVISGDRASIKFETPFSTGKNYRATVDLTFTRSKNETLDCGPSTVTPEEQKMVGIYEQAPDIDKLTAKQVEDLHRMERPIRMFLRADKTFYSSMASTKGTWKLNGNDVEVAATEMAGMTMSNTMKPMNLATSPDGTLRMQGLPDKANLYIFKKQ